MQKLVGQPLRRREDMRLLTGQGRFVDDFKCADLHHAVVVRSPVAAGRIRGIDKAAALALPGVVAVLDAADFSGCTRPIPLRGGILPGLLDYLQPVIARNRVCYVGEPVALVVATSRALAEDAADAVLPDIEATAPVVTFEAARAGRVLVHPASGRNVAEDREQRPGRALSRSRRRLSGGTTAARTRRQSRPVLTREELLQH